MKILSICVMRWNKDTDDAIILHGAYNLDDFSFFQKGSMKEFFSFVSKTIMKRVGEGINVVEHEGHLVFANVEKSGLGVVALTDMEYPTRVAVTMTKDVLAQFKLAHPTTWRKGLDNSCPFPALETILREFQDPSKVDKIMKLERQLDDTKEILHKTIDKVLERGEKLDDLVEKSNALSTSSKQFYKQSKKVNSCCTIM